MPDNADKPKIIVDEDWKSQVQAEKETAKVAATKSAAPSESSTTPPTVTDPLAAGSTGGAAATAAKADPATKPAATAERPPERPLPPATLTFLCTTVATEAMMALGQMPNPITGKTELHLHQAKHFIDTLAMLEEKTTGNRTPEETGLLSELLHQLRMAFVMSNK